MHFPERQAEAADVVATLVADADSAVGSPPHLEASGLKCIIMTTMNIMPIMTYWFSVLGVRISCYRATFMDNLFLNFDRRVVLQNSNNCYIIDIPSVKGYSMNYCCGTLIDFGQGRVASWRVYCFVRCPRKYSG